MSVVIVSFCLSVFVMQYIRGIVS